jgi:SAM domain (Sterile alpha motif)
MMDVGSWLRGLGLEKYEAAFRENEIDETVLPSLTADDLKDLGIGIVGHRRKPSLLCAPMQTRKYRFPTLFRRSAGPPKTLPNAVISP